MDSKRNIFTVSIVIVVLITGIGLVIWLIKQDRPSLRLDSWVTYVNRQYGYEVKYPKNWRIEEPSSENHDYLDRKWVKFVSPVNPRHHSVIGSTTFGILVERVSQPWVRELFVRCTEKLDNSEEHNFQAVLAYRGHDSETTRCIFTDVAGQPDFFISLIETKIGLYSVSLPSGFSPSLSEDDLDAFFGISQSFAVL